MISLQASVVHRMTVGSKENLRYLIELIDKNILDTARRGLFQTCFILKEHEREMHPKLTLHYISLGYKSHYDDVMRDLTISW